MNFISTRDQTAPATLATALRAGLAPDGGLYVPESLPAFSPADLAGCSDLPATAEQVLADFFADSELTDELATICREALDLPLPLTGIGPYTWMLELHHGPTAAFKDFAARFLAACLQRLRKEDEPEQTVIVATSGDTGAAVAAAFHRRPGFRVVILYPDGRVSERQAHQLGCFGDNITTFRVDGDFDTCQRLAKWALGDADLARQLALTSANSISIGRLLPQIAYFVHATAALWRSIEQPVDVIVPTGNLGNALAAILAREIGLPIGEVVLATNANRTLPDFFSGQRYRGRPGIRTLANAMDVGDPSNFERLAWFFRDRDLRDAGIDADTVDDDTIRSTIKTVFDGEGRVICPHTACAMAVLARRREAGNRQPTVIAATAHPAKFDSVVEPLIGRSVALPPALAELMERPSRAEALEGSIEAFRERLKAWQR
ncbi:threonine synthase [Wenzhouxiangella sp. AB-CW3]|uniref:threonine synthase n=1 Tax=Wenzhouxiangella sp. AB-CW3 TaxID=2771012 RepID=UPI00168AE5BD|nr:threonine synthase [Wenzhouxiangella sp. AB-CW3]QOC23453.1 threonine synthase [Wenzhouxiangella sp. AB-CW3]